MNEKQLRRLRLVPGDILLVRGPASVGEIIELRRHFNDRVTVAQVPHKNFLERIPFEILERIYLGAKKSFDEKQFVELGPDFARVSLSSGEMKTILEGLNSIEYREDLASFESAKKKVLQTLAPVLAVERAEAEAANADKTPAGESVQ